jgi:hypothetical protein
MIEQIEGFDCAEPTEEQMYAYNPDPEEICDRCGKNLMFECECEPEAPCPICRTQMEFGGGAGYPGESFEWIECPVCRYRELYFETPDSTCQNCGEKLDLIDADASGPHYGQCRHCFEPDVFNPRPNVFRY